MSSTVENLTSYNSKEMNNHESNHMTEKYGEPPNHYDGDNTKTNCVEKPSSAENGEEIVVFNIGGEIFETFRETIRKDDISVLGNDDFLRRYYRAKAGVYFFDRDPDVFRAVLNYLRTGELHLPSYVCGPAAKTELAFWGVQPSKIERCCWTNYNDWNATLEALKRFEKDRKTTILSSDRNAQEKTVRQTWWEKWRPIVWRFLSRSNSSTGAKVLGIISLFFVFVSIFTFIAETTDPFLHYITIPNSTYRENATFSYHPTANATVGENDSTSNDDSHKYIKIESKHPVIFAIDMVCLTFFTLEYITRLIFSPRKCRFFISILSLVDVLAILPDYVELMVYSISPELQKDVTAVHYISILRVARVLRIFRLIRHVPGLWILVYTLRASVSELMLLVWFMVLGVLVFSSLIFFVDDKDKFQNIPEGFWWALITMTTVGYGDMYPTTHLGKIIGSFCAISGVLMIGFTVPALVNNFMLYYRHVQFAVQLENQCEEEKREQESREIKENNIPYHKAAIPPLDSRNTKVEHESEPLMKQRNNNLDV